MPELIQMQTPFRSNWDKSKLCSFDMEVIDAPTQPLIHQEARFLFVNKGEGVIVVQGKPYPLRAGTLLAILPWEISEVVEVTSPLQYYLLIYHFDTLCQLMKTFYNNNNEPIQLVNHFARAAAVYCDGEQARKVSGIFHELRDEIGAESAPQSAPSQQPLSGVSITNHLVELIVLFVRLGKQDVSLEEVQGSERANEEIFYYIYTHLNGKISLKMLSQVFYRSESAISRYIKQMTGLSLTSLCHEMRICKAANYLLHTDLTLEELAEILGYADASHISKVFSARIGMKISEYRKTYQKVTDICKVKETKKAYVLVSYIYANHAEELTAQSVCAHMDISAAELNRTLLYQVEKNFEDFLHYTRINHACRLLLTTNESILTIAVEVGYNNTKTFTRNFLKWKVCMPADFRRRVHLQHGIFAEPAD
ncbi:MAG: AraC family transcriptional regulator [Ruthenibacterium sp.]